MPMVQLTMTSIRFERAPSEEDAAASALKEVGQAYSGLYSQRRGVRFLLAIRVEKLRLSLFPMVGGGVSDPSGLLGR
ncbi:hypothetical protein B296_00011035 [Ensete ventricosum]|uniref:Uncharacterized protein n=1 Tax=Ensete ventricosum TaxID=4639 RepID=A0A427A6R8_ENSVE|nr:hypothetical protein B296_00011035 [Ensete ventricosum]